MTSKHYTRLARRLNDYWIDLDPDSKEDSNFWGMVNGICDDLLEDNTRFDGRRFLAAVTDEVRGG
jgi:hypothetical protein